MNIMRWLARRAAVRAAECFEGLADELEDAAPATVCAPGTLGARALESAARIRTAADRIRTAVAWPR